MLHRMGGEPVADGHAQRMRNQSIEMVLPLDDRGDPILAVLHHEVESRLEAARTTFASNLRDGSTSQAGIFRPARTRRNANPIRFECFDFIDRDFVVSFHAKIDIHLAEELDEVVSERIVIID